MKKLRPFMYFVSGFTLFFLFSAMALALTVADSSGTETEASPASGITTTTNLNDNAKYAVDFEIINYNGGSTTTITIANLGDTAITDWKLTWTFNDSAQISQFWCANYTQADQAVEITPKLWNQTIAPQSSICLGFCSASRITKPNNLNLVLPNDVASEDPIVNQTTDATKLVNANSQFAFEIFKQLNATETDNNIFISPFSISTALTMLYQGANSETRDEIAQTLHYSGIDISQLNSDYQSLLSGLEEVDSFVTLNIANSIWYKDSLEVKSDFLNTNNDVFGAAIKELDFTKADAADTINNWISEATNGMIDRMLEPPLSGIMYLINAIYFKGAWTDPFDPKLTTKANFTTESGKSTMVDMMHAARLTEFGKGTDYSAVRLPYGEERVSMYCILPAQGLSVDQLISGLSVAKFNEIKQSLSKRYDFNVYLPKFKMTYGVKRLKTTLKTLGMNQAFDAWQADFSGITTEPLWVEDVLHKATIDVNEQGTEAAAATVVITYTGVAESFRVDRPFVFLIVDDTTGSILFMGKAADLVEY
jgi:serine protease inhibitor